MLHIFLLGYPFGNEGILLKNRLIVNNLEASDLKIVERAGKEFFSEMTT